MVAKERNPDVEILGKRSGHVPGVGELDPLTVRDAIAKMMGLPPRAAPTMSPQVPLDLAAEAPRPLSGLQPSGDLLRHDQGLREGRGLSERHRLLHHGGGDGDRRHLPLHGGEHHRRGRDQVRGRGEADMRRPRRLDLPPLRPHRPSQRRLQRGTDDGRDPRQLHHRHDRPPAPSRLGRDRLRRVVAPHLPGGYLSIPGRGAHRDRRPLRPRFDDRDLRGRGTIPASRWWWPRGPASSARSGPGVRRPRLAVDVEKCSGCKVCVKFGCPAIEFDGKVARINALCTGCGVCAAICPAGAIEVVK